MDLNFTVWIHEYCGHESFQYGMQCRSCLHKITVVSEEGTEAHGGGEGSEGPIAVEVRLWPIYRRLRQLMREEGWKTVRVYGDEGAALALCPTCVELSKEALFDVDCTATCNMWEGVIDNKHG